MTSRRIVATAPARVDLAGGWTDVAPYTTAVGGAVCNVAIELRATATLTPGADATPPDSPLVHAAWDRAGRPAVTIVLASEIPVGSGLGGSSAAGVALAAAFAAWQDRSLSPQELAELSRVTEIESMGLAGGCQDHYAAAFGGALLLSCREFTEATRVAMQDTAVDQFEQRALIAYTGESRMSSSTINAVMNSYMASDAHTCGALRMMANLAPLMASALEGGDIDLLGGLVAEQWQAQRALHATITTPLIDRIVTDCAAAGALGSKALGASGGGCVLVIAHADRVGEVRSTLARHATLLPLRVARTGVHVHTTAAD